MEMFSRLSRLLLFFMTTVTVSAGWEILPPLPEPNGGFACGVADGKIFVLGGTNWRDNEKRWLDGIWMFDPKSRRWEVRGQLPHALAYPVVGEWRGELIVGGGYDGVQPRKEIYRLTASGMVAEIGKLHRDRTLAAGGVMDDQLLVLGGTPDPTKFDLAHQNGERFKLSGGAGSSAMAIPTNAVFNIAASAVVGGEVFLFGGGRHDPGKELKDLDRAWAFDVAKNKWRNLRRYPLTVRGATAVKLDNDRILVAGGYGGYPANFSAATYIYDVRRDAYAKTIDLPVAALVGLVVTDGYVYCLGGEDKMKHRTDLCARIPVKEFLDAAK